MPTPSNDVEIFSLIINKHSALPSKIVEADFVEFQKGDGILGPSDFVFYARFKIDALDVPKWTHGLHSLGNTIAYTFPTPNFSWWVNRAKFEKLQTYETKKYFGRFNGWLAVDKESGYIYVYTFTM